MHHHERIGEGEQAEMDVKVLSANVSKCLCMALRVRLNKKPDLG